MRSIVRSLGLLALALNSLSACARRAPEEGPPRLDPTVYFPLAVGNHWAYEGNFLGQKIEMRVEILRQVDGHFEDNQNGRLIADDYGVRDEKRYLLRAPLEVGRSWTNVVSVSSVEHYKVIEAGQRCEAPAGRFENCVRVEARTRVDEKTTLVNEMTFAPAVGLIRRSVVAESGGQRIPQTTVELREYRLAQATGAAP